MIMPIIWTQRGKKSDRTWIESQMIHIPAGQQQAVADEYVRKLSNGAGSLWERRRQARIYLQAISLECRQDKYAQQKQDM